MFLIDREARCNVTLLIFRGPCPMKIKAFFWLAWDNKILTLDNLFARGYNKLPMTTCNLYSGDIEMVEHLFFKCLLVVSVWNLFALTLGFHRAPTSSSDMWVDWLRSLNSSLKPTWSLLAKAILWLLWLTHNDCMFTFVSLSPLAVRVKICYLFHFWIDIVPISKR